jgi:hypothetical protein
MKAFVLLDTYFSRNPEEPNYFANLFVAKSISEYKIYHE